MKHKKWWIPLSVASVLIMFCVVRAIWRPAASDAAHRIEVGASRTQSDENAMDTRLQRALESMDADNAKAADAATLKQLEAAKEAQLRQQQAAREPQPTQQETPAPSSENPGLSIEAVVGTGSGFHAVIGDRVVREGDVVNGYTVLKIRADRVELGKDGSVFVQKMD